MINISISNDIRIFPKNEIKTNILNTIKTDLTFENPLYRRGLKRSRTGSQVTPELVCWFENGDSLITARGYLQTLLERLKYNDIGYLIVDQTIHPESLEFRYQGRLTAGQLNLANKALNVAHGIVPGIPGRGLESLALYIISKRRMPFIVIVKRRARLRQWRKFIAEFTDLDSGKIGIVGTGKTEVDCPVIIAIDRSLYAQVDKLKHQFGLIAVDLCDLANLKIFFSGVAPFPCRYILGLSTTMGRRDGLHGLMEAYLGRQLLQASVVKGI